MSLSASYGYSLSAAEREERRLAQVRTRTEASLAQLRAQLETLAGSAGLRWVEKEVHDAMALVLAAEAALAQSPDEAERLQREAGRRVHALPHLIRVAREAEAERRRQAELQRQRLNAAARTWVDQQLAAIDDPAVRDFAMSSLANLREEASTLNVADPVAWQTRAARVMERVLAESAEKAKHWRDQRRREALRESRADVVEHARQAVTSAKGADPRTVADAVRALEALQERLSGSEGPAADRLDAAVGEVMGEVQASELAEDCRREVVVRIVRSLRKAGFTVDGPKRQRDGGRDNVVIVARKPRGSRAQFRVGLDGKLDHKFDHYEGSACHTDIDQVMDQMREVYGVHLTDERVHWRNPDRLSRDARPLPGTREEER